MQVYFSCGAARGRHGSRRPPPSVASWQTVCVIATPDIAQCIIAGPSWRNMRSWLILHNIWLSKLLWRLRTVRAADKERRGGGRRRRCWLRPPQNGRRRRSEVGGLLSRVIKRKLCLQTAQIISPLIPPPPLQARPRLRREGFTDRLAL